MKKDITNSQTLATELEQCTFVKTILMAIVVVYHSCVFWTGSWSSCGQQVAFESPYLSVLAEWLNSFHVYSFTLTSGFIYYYLEFECNKYNDFKTLIYKKIKRLIVPYYFVALIWAGPVAAIIHGYSFKELVTRYLFAISPNQLWFLWMLFWCFLFAKGTKKLIKNDKAATIMIMLSWAIGLLGGYTS